MHSIGIDTIRFYKDYGRDAARELILPHVRKGSKGNRWFHGALIGLVGESSTNFWIETSFAREGSENDCNLELATPEIFENAILKFEEQSGLQIRDARVSRLDMALTFHSVHPVLAYLPLLEPVYRYKLEKMDSGHYLNSSETVLTLYDKRKEMEAKSKKLWGEWSDGHLARIEFRCRKVRKHLKLPIELPDITIADLASHNIFSAGVRMLEGNATRLMRLNNLQSATTTGTKSTDVENNIIRALMAKYPDQYREIREIALLQAGLSDGLEERFREKSDRELMLPYRQEVHRAMQTACAQMYQKYPMVITLSPDVLEARELLGRAA